MDTTTTRASLFGALRAVPVALDELSAAALTGDTMLKSAVSRPGTPHHTNPPGAA